MSGFVGSHLRNRLAREETFQVLPYEDSFYENPGIFIDFVQKADVIVHLAGVNRHEPEIVYRKNIELMKHLLQFVDASGNKPYILFSSSTQIERDNEYGRGKKQAMELLEEWSVKTRSQLYRWLFRMSLATAAEAVLTPLSLHLPSDNPRPAAGNFK